MTTFPTTNEQGQVIAFQINNIYIGRFTAARILRRIDGVSDVRIRMPLTADKDIRVWFKYMDRDCVVMEPWGDNDRYFIYSTGINDFDISAVERAFREAHPSLFRIMLWVGFALFLFWRLANAL